MSGVPASYGAGRVVGEDGTAELGTHVRVGDTSRALVGPGLVNPRGGEVILVVETHGPKVPYELIGRPGPNDGAEIQVSVHGPTP